MLPPLPQIKRQGTQEMQLSDAVNKHLGKIVVAQPP